MHFTNESQHEYRYGDKGPKYLARGPRSDFGIVILQPGQDFQCHKHERIEEAWYTIEGEIHLHVDGEWLHLKQGDYLRCDPGEAHYFVNKGNVPWKAVFVKAPYDPDDSVTMENP